MNTQFKYWIESYVNQSGTVCSNLYRSDHTNTKVEIYSTFFNEWKLSSNTIGYIDNYITKAQADERILELKMRKHIT